MVVFVGADNMLRRSRILISIVVTLAVFFGGVTEGFAVEITIDSPTNDTLPNNAPDLNFTTDEPANITYAWGGEGNISGCRNCTSFNTTYGEYNGSGADLAALWHFNENFANTVYDDSGYSNDGLLVNGAGWATGRWGYGLKLDGVDDGVNVTYASSLDILDEDDGSKPFAFGVWFKLSVDALSSNNVILSQQDGAGMGRTWININGSDHKLVSWLGYDGATNNGVTSNTIFTEDAWYFTVLTFNGTDIDLYVNGTFDTSVADSSVDENATGKYLFGRTKNLGSYFNGTIDEVIFFNRSLSAAEIRELYNRTLPDGQHNVTVHANSGALNSTTRLFTVDITNPIINNPTHNINGSLVGGGDYVNLSVEVIGNAAIDTVIFNISNTNYTANSVSGTNFYEIQFNASGIYCWNQTWVNDTAANTDVNSSVGLCWEVDALAPTVGTPEINSTADTINYDVRINATVSDPENNLGTPILEVNRPTSADYNVSMTLASGTEYEKTIAIDEAGIWSFKIYINDTTGNGAWSSQVQTVAFASDEFGGDSTDLASIPDISNISNFVLENPSYGKINFSSVDLSSGADLNTYVNISNNRIWVNSTALPALNTSATLYLYGLTLDNPRILRDGGVCPSSICTIVTYSGGNLTFNVNHFTTYSADETPSSSPSSPSSGGGGGDGCSHLLSIKDYQISGATVGETAVLSLTIENTGCNERAITVWVPSLPAGWSADNKTLDIPVGVITVNLTLDIPASEDPGRQGITVELTPKYFTTSFTEKLWVGVKASVTKERPTVITTTITLPPTTTTILPATTTMTTIPPQTTVPPIQKSAPPVGKIALALVLILIIAAGIYFYRYHKRKKVEWWNGATEAKERHISGAEVLNKLDQLNEEAEETKKKSDEGEIGESGQPV